MLWIKRLSLVIVISVVGYLFLLHAGMASDQEPYLKWYYKVEIALSAILWWPASLYLGARKLLGYENGILGFELWFFQFSGYLIAMKSYGLIKKHNKDTN